MDADRDGSVRRVRPTCNPLPSNLHLSTSELHRLIPPFVSCPTRISGRLRGTHGSLRLFILSRTPEHDPPTSATNEKAHAAATQPKARRWLPEPLRSHHNRQASDSNRGSRRKPVNRGCGQANRPSRLRRANRPWFRAMSPLQRTATTGHGFPRDRSEAPRRTREERPSRVTVHGVGIVGPHREPPGYERAESRVFGLPSPPATGGRTRSPCSSPESARVRRRFPRAAVCGRRSSS
jgi:hypothetical protein